ncbi:beta/gamma crystallin domain-containing protein [Simplicispira metamorpha]|uniref:Beta/gamma crystallin n=1 Tax=Simplicispira metamorpha TaxID=80881 RepID=A0A4V2SIU7_9BURK|nr:beta/gamma crystallin domain-containing protein [Simplicispira metamorpha]TCP11273.1 beta/gamma crystallin [Simplicispira metamorpha]
MLRHMRAILVMGSLGAALSCANAQITVFTQPNFQGESLQISENNWSSGGAGTKWNDTIKSVKVPDGWTVKLYEHTDKSGKVQVLTKDLAKADSFGISSIEIFSSPNHGCYYQDSKEWSKWTKNGGFAKDVKTLDQCVALDGCMKGGGNKSGGGCYVYASSPAAAAEILKSSGRK